MTNSNNKSQFTERQIQFLDEKLLNCAVFVAKYNAGATIGDIKNNLFDCIFNDKLSTLLNFKD
jgi:hypothetical protein